MKKLLLLCAALLWGSMMSPLSAESYGSLPVEPVESDETEPITLRIIPRFDVEPQIALTEGSKEAVRSHNNLDGTDGFYSNSSVYTHFEGDIIPGLHFHLVNHWLAGSAEAIRSLYQWTSDFNWCDFATLSYEYEGFTFTLGKDCLAVATYEYDPYDFDCYYLLSSGMWNNLNCYQLGAKVAYSFSDSKEVGFQVSSSPLNETPFSEGYLSYSLYGFFDKEEDEDEGFSYRLALNAMQFDRKDAAVPGSKSNFIWQPSIGLRYDINDLYVGLDAAARFASASIYDPTLEVPEDALSPIREGNIILNFGYNYDDKLEFFARAGWEPVSGTYTYLNYAELTEDEEYAISYPNGRGFLGGIGVNWYPLKDSQDLRIHAVVGGSNYAQALSLNFGVTYFFEPLKLFARK
jgi:hypothetical protein